MVYRCILPDWAKAENPSLPKVVEGDYSFEELLDLNEQFYNIYYLPNYPSQYEAGTTVDGSQIDVFTSVWVDMDLKQGVYGDKDSFIDLVASSDLTPTSIIDSGNGVHVYWEVTDLDAMSFLKLQRRLMRKFRTDEAVAKIYQLMRVPGTLNTKNPDDLKLCTEIFKGDKKYTCEELDKLLPPLSQADAAYCEQHYGKTYRKKQTMSVNDVLPLKFAKLIKSNKEAAEIWTGGSDDRSKSDYRLGHIMFGNGFTRDEAMSVLVNSAKALVRAPVHRVGYAEGIIDKIWTYEMAEDKTSLTLSSSVRDILNKFGDGIKGKRFPCWKWLDDTEHGFRLGQVLGLVAGSGVGKTAVALNMFMGFVECNPDYDHFFIPLEQPANEIADRWKSLCGDKTHLYDKVHVMSNYADDGTFRHLSFEEIKEYILKFQEVTKRKVGCVVIDHIGALKKKGKDGENQDIMDICHAMKGFAVETNTFLVMQSQSSRDKAGIGDLELNKDAAYGSVYFESYCDFLVTIHQPVKRCHAEEGCPTITSFKFCKIRNKKKEDGIKEDINYNLFFDTNTGLLRETTAIEDTSFNFFYQKAVNTRKRDRKTDLITYTSIRTNVTQGGDNDADTTGR